MTDRTAVELAVMAHHSSVESVSLNVRPAANSYTVYAPDVATLLWTRLAPGDVTFTSRWR
jgi:hypothetical protein